MLLGFALGAVDAFEITDIGELDMNMRGWSIYALRAQKIADAVAAIMFKLVEIAAHGLSSVFATRISIPFWEITVPPCGNSKPPVA